jgi:hypothetical protein
VAIEVGGIESPSIHHSNVIGMKIGQTAIAAAASKSSRKREEERERERIV